MNRRTALGFLAVAGLTGCSFRPIEWVEPTAEPTVTADPAVEVRADFFVQTTDPGVKTLEGGRSVGLRISTPHFDGVLDQLSISERLSRQDSAQVRQPTEIRAPQRHELLAFTLRAGVPVFQPEDLATVQFRLRVGATVDELGPPFGQFIVSDSAEYEIPWALFVLAVPIGEAVTLEVTDQERTVLVNLITGDPIDDDAWADTAGFRERQLITLDPPKGTFVQGVTSVPGPGQEPDQATLTFPLTANERASILAPWLPERGWAPAGAQWLRLRFALDPRFDNPLFRYEFNGPQTFTYEDGRGAARPALSPETLSTEDVEISTTLDVTFEVPSEDPAGTLLCRPTGKLEALYVNSPAVPAQFVGQAAGISFGVGFSPEPQPG